MSDKPSDSSERDSLRNKAISRWDNEGGAGEAGREYLASMGVPPETPPLTNAELVQLQIRVIALENVLTVLLAGSSDRQLDLVREMATYIAPRPGFTPHRLTVHAAARIISLMEGAEHVRALSAAGSEPDAPPDAAEQA